ncbi:MAG: ABC transporter substrate-binding protein [Clostridia bacterium]|nr:ABC transporter substrate-binding protein [Clostridia bacterium]
MKLHIDTAPVWEVYRQDHECPLCAISDRVEAASVEYFLGDSVMEPSQRIEVNEKGFCGRHFKLMFDAGNRLGLALMTHTYMKNTLKWLRQNAESAVAAASAEAAKPVFKRVIAKKGEGLAVCGDEVLALEDKCVMCERIRDNMRRYIYTILYMYKHEPEFPGLLEGSKGMCLKHYAETMKMAPEHLSGEALKRFVQTLSGLETENLQRVADELEWFTRKFDYRNEDKPWGNSRDAVERSLNKLRGHIVN